MPYCTHCGKEISGEEQFCPNCGTAVISKTIVSQSAAPAIPSTPSNESGRGIVLASWGDRFIAWLIDVVIIGAIAELLQLPALRILNVPFFSVGSRDVILLLYWTLTEGFYGKSIGKMVMRLKVTRLDGTSATLVDAAIESFGKAFLLPIDCIIGWIAEDCKENKQRLFSMLAKTKVIKA